MYRYVKLQIVLKLSVSTAVFVFFGRDISADVSPFTVSEPKVQTELIESSSHDYTINLGGTVDMDNTTTRGYPSYEVAFQPNISLEIHNVGSTPVVDPWIVINDVRDWRNIDSIIAEATRGSEDVQDRLLLLYEFARSHRYHDNPLFTDDELHDPVKHFNLYCAGFCDDIGRVTCALAYQAGFTEARHGGDPVVRSMHGHVMSEIAVNGQYQFIDTDENAFYLDPENERPVSGDEIVRDSDLAGRDYTYGPLFRSSNNQRASALLGRDDGKSRSITTGHEMHLTLRPGEKLTLRWDNIGKTPGPNTLKHFANSFLDYVPELNETCLDYATQYLGIETREGTLVGITDDSFITFVVKSPYVICGETVKAQFECGESDDMVSVSVSPDGKTWSDVWQRRGRGIFSCEAVLDDSLGIKNEVPRYRYFVRINLASTNESSQLLALKFHTDLLASFISLPRLSLGTNTIRYTDSTNVPHSVKVTHTYQESYNITPPNQTEPVYPPDKAVSDDDWIEFSWRKVINADKYHLRVSRRADLRTTYRPCFDVIVDTTTYRNPRTGLFNPNETYYWSVRARNSEGVWGDWCPAQTFSWTGSRPPVGLKTATRENKIYLTWQPNHRGNRPARYEIYASDIKGFMPSKKPYTVVSLGEMQPNFAAETPATEILIVSFDPADNAPNKSSYRIIALDENGTCSGSSWPLELEHPFIYSIPPLETKIENPYEYHVLTLQSLGDLQYRYQKPVYAFWEREGYEFFLTEAPDWLKIDPERGVISGTPSKYDIGENRVTITVNRTFPVELTTDDDRPEHFMKDGLQFQGTDKQSYILKVTR